MIDKVDKIKESMVRGDVSKLYPVYGVFSIREYSSLCAFVLENGISSEVWDFYRVKLEGRVI